MVLEAPRMLVMVVHQLLLLPLLLYVVKVCLVDAARGGPEWSA